MISFASIQHQLDELLERLCVEIQITDTQYNNAERSYHAVGDWLQGGTLEKFSPDIFPQGSMALGTTVKPRAREEFDVDLVCLLNLDPAQVGPMTVYNLVLARLMANELYAPMVEPMARCIRLNYKGQFHLDIIPACPSPQWGHLHGEFGIVIPDREKKQWVSTNPRGFVLWFAARALGQTSLREGIQLSAAPLPPNVEASEKAPLQRIVQLYKRRRDVHYNGHDHAPKSILLTTLCGMFHPGDRGITKGVVDILDRLIAQSHQLTPGTVPTVPNPTNPDENLARHWKEPGHYRRFVEYVSVYREGMRRYIDAPDLPKRAAVLNELFDPTGTGIVTRAVKAYTKSIQTTRNSGGILLQGENGSRGRGLTTATAGALAFASTSFFGDE